MILLAEVRRVGMKREAVIRGRIIRGTSFSHESNLCVFI